MDVKVRGDKYEPNHPDPDDYEFDGDPYHHYVFDTFNCKLDFENDELYYLAIDRYNEYNRYVGLYEARFSDGKLKGNYCMPLYHNFPCTQINDALYNKIINKVQAVLLGKDLFNNDVLNINQDRLDDYFEEPIIAEGFWSDGKFRGKAESGENNKIKFSAEWNDGVLHIEHKERGLTIKSTVRNGKKDGIYQVFDNDELVEEAEYKEGKLHGIRRKWSRPPHRWLDSETSYKEGKKHGFEKIYHSDGTINEIKYWQNGRDCTQYRKILKYVAGLRIKKEDDIEEKTGNRKCLPKMNKFRKAMTVYWAVLRNRVQI